MRAKRYLQQLAKLDALIKNKLIERQQLYEFATSTVGQTGGERVQSTGNPQKMADAVNKYVDLEREIDAQIDAHAAKKREILSVIESLDVISYDFLHAVYVQNLSLSDAADEFGKSYSWATTVHGTALKAVQKILDERERSEE